MNSLRFCSAQSLENNGVLLVAQSRTKVGRACRVKKKIPASHASNDQSFLEKVSGIIDQHLADDTFTVITFSREVGASRAQLYRRVKALTGPACLSISYYVQLALSVFRFCCETRDFLFQRWPTGWDSVRYRTLLSASKRSTVNYPVSFASNPNEFLTFLGVGVNYLFA